MWLLYFGLGVAASLVLLALLLVKLHFCLKSQGYNFLFRSQSHYPPPVPVKKDLDIIKECDIHQIDIEVGKSEKDKVKQGGNKNGDTDTEGEEESLL